MGDRDVVDVHDGGKRDVLGVEARFEDRPKAGIFAQRLVSSLGFGAGGARARDREGAVKDGVGDELRARAALFKADARQVGQVQQAQEDDDHAHDGRDAEDLLAFDA